MEGRKVDLVKSYAFPGATAEDDLQSQLSQFLASQDSSKDTDNSSGARVSTLYGMLSRRCCISFDLSQLDLQLRRPDSALHRNKRCVFYARRRRSRRYG